MVTHSRTVQVRLDEGLFQAVQSLAEANQRSIPDVSSELIQLALEERQLEETHFSKIVKDRLSKKNIELSHDEVWDALSDSVR